jgi:hypothetical protein
MRGSAVLAGVIGLAVVFVVASPLANSASAGAREVQYTQAPGWVAPLPTPTNTASPPDAGYRVIYSDNQIHLGPDGFESYQAYRLKILKPEALQAGNISLTWNPDAGEAKVHYLRIVRDQETIDVLKSIQFQVLQREGFLEQSMLSGNLTAVIQSPGLQVGDELEFAATVRRKEVALGDHQFGFAALPPTGGPGAFRIRMAWPKDRSVRWRASPDITGVAPKVVNGQTELVYDLRDPRPATITDGAPDRFNIRRFIEVSDFESWKDVSGRMWPLFEKASVLPPDSPLRKEIARIAAADTDRVKRMAAALQLVQEQVRYVYIGLNGGNFTPATVDETWSRRFGDCKAKTVLLLAILRELGIYAEPVLVNSSGGDGVNERLPTPGMFDHVLVRVNLTGTIYWLDGTRLGDRTMGKPAPYFWVLPLRGGGADLEKVAIEPPAYPYSISVLDVDATAGFDKKAKVTIQQAMRGDIALLVRSQLIVLSGENLDRALQGFWRQANPWVEPEKVAWKFNEQQGTLLLTVTGQGKLDWTGDDKEGRSMDIPGAGFTPPAEYQRPKDQDQQAPWATDYPMYNCYVTSIRLPAGDSKWKWDYFSDPMDVRMGGVRYLRFASLDNGVMQTVMSRRVEVPEITAAQAEDVNQRVPTFNNKISRVYQIDANAGGRRHPFAPPLPLSEVDWGGKVNVCGRSVM